MSRTNHQGERRIRVRGVRREATDLRRLARALIELAQAEAEAAAQADHEKQTKKGNRRNVDDSRAGEAGDTSRRRAE